MTDADKTRIEKTAEFAKLKYQVSEILCRKFLEYNDGKFHTGIELNPASHALTEFMAERLNQERNKAIDRIRNIYIDGLPTGDCQAWDFIKHAKEFTDKLESLKSKPE